MKRINLIKSFDNFRSINQLNENVQQAKAFLKKRAKEAKALTLNKNDVELTEQEIRAAENDKTYLEIKELLKDNPGLVYMFVKFHYEENIPMDELKMAYANIRELKNSLSALPRKIEQYVDLTKGDEKRTSFEILQDDLRELDIQRIVKKFVDRLPGEFVVTNPNARDKGEKVPSIKNAYKTATAKQKEKIRGIALAFEELGDTPEQTKALQELFLQGIKRYRTLNEVIQAAQQHIKASSNTNVASLLANINKANELYGFANGAEVLYNINDRVVFEVRSFQANSLINACTRHCIKDTYSSWDHYLGDSHYNKQYYIWDFNYPPNDNKSIIGITIAPGPKIYACHLKDDAGFSNEFKNHIKDIGIDWALFAPMTAEEQEVKRKRVEANKKIVSSNISISVLQSCIDDGADPNAKDGTPLSNAAAEGDIAKVDFLLAAGAKVNIGNPMKNAKGVSVLAKLIENGAEITLDVMNANINDPEAVRLLLDSGLDPNSQSAMPIRVAVKNNAIESLKMLLDENGSVLERDCLAIRYCIGMLLLECFQLCYEQFLKTGGTLTPDKLSIKGDKLMGKWSSVGTRMGDCEWHKPSMNNTTEAEKQRMKEEMIQYLKTIAIPVD